MFIDGIERFNEARAPCTRHIERKFKLELCRLEVMTFNPYVERCPPLGRRAPEPSQRSSKNKWIMRWGKTHLCTPPTFWKKGASDAQKPCQKTQSPQPCCCFLHEAVEHSSGSVNRAELWRKHMRMPNSSAVGRWTVGAFSPQMLIETLTFDATPDRSQLLSRGRIELLNSVNPCTPKPCLHAPANPAQILQ